MKNVYLVLICMAVCLSICNSANAQSVTVSGTVFLPQDSIEFSYEKPSFTSTDWIGIYKPDQVPGEVLPSITWKYITSASGTLKLAAPDEAGNYKAYLFCCDGYEIVATSAEFSIQIPSLETSFPDYAEGDSIVLSYLSPKFSATDKLAIYSSEVVPSAENQPLDWKYIPAGSGTMTFKTALPDGLYTAYLLCCDGYDTIATADFEVVDQATAFLTPKYMEFESGTTIDIYYNDPSFATGDQVAIYADGEIVGNNYITIGYVLSETGVVSFPGVLAPGIYFAALSCCNTPASEYARSDAFVIKGISAGSYVKTSTAVYPASASIFVNYKDVDLQDKDWIGIYKKGDVPGGPTATTWQYVTKDSSTVEFAPLTLGEYVVYLFCCDGYNIKARSEFKVVGPNTASIVSSAFSYGPDEPMEFIYNDPNFESGNGTDWIGIYYPDDIPANVRSMIWSYITTANGTETYSVPYPNGTWPEDFPDTPLAPGEYVAYLFCCDAYTVYASTKFIITQFPSGNLPELKSENSISLFPNPTTGFVTVKLKEGGKIQKILIYNLSGQVVYEESEIGSIHEKSLDLKLDKGIYFLDVIAEQSRSSKKLVVQ